jgi:hypothetical protein
MGTLSTELGPLAGRIANHPRVYVDANVPARVVSFMRERLHWDVFFVMEHDDLRRARDVAHYQLARQLRRTLLTFDRDYFDDRRFPPAEGAGVIVLSAPDERGLTKLLMRLDRLMFRTIPTEGDAADADLPLAGRKLHVDVGWPGSDVPR